MFENITITIKDILQSYSFPDVIPHDEPWKSLTVDQIIENGKDKFFDFTFPWYAEDNSGLDDFKNLFLRKYYMCQIGQETTAQFKLYLQARLMEKMSLYKQLYETTLIEYDPLVNRKINRSTDETQNKERGKETSANTEDTNTAEGSSETTQTQQNIVNNQAVHSENPEITMANKDYASSMDREKKQDNGDGTENITASSSQNGNAHGESTENEKEENIRNENELIEGFYGDSQADAILKYRETILNINEMICNDMKNLFLGYYGGVDYALTY